MTHLSVYRVSHLAYPLLSVYRGLWIPQVVPIPKKLVGLPTLLVRPTEATVETLVTPSPTTAMDLSPACPKASSMALLTDSEALCILLHPSLSTPTLAETPSYPLSLARIPVPLSHSRLKLLSVPTRTLPTSVSATTCWVWVFPQ